MTSPQPQADPWADDEFWAAFDVEPDPDRPKPWYRKTARWVAALIVLGLLGTGALNTWGTVFDRLDNVSDPVDIRELAEETVAESPYAWLVERVQIRDIPAQSVAGFVHSSPADGVITLDLIGWEPDDLRSTVDHEIGHLLDFAAYGDSVERRQGLPSEVWAECAAVDAGSRNLDGGTSSTGYYCTSTELEQYRFAVSSLGEICRPWGETICRSVTPRGP